MHPILFKIGPVSIYSYGVMVAVAVIIALYLARRQALKNNVNPEIILDLGIYALISGIIGARLLYILTNIRHYLIQPLEIVMLNHGGLVSYGGIIVGSLIGIFFLKKRNLPVLKITDMVIPYVALGQAIGRIGCFLNGCCYGRPTNVSWGVYFPGSSLTLHPTQAYFCLNALVIFLILRIIQEAKRFDGQVLIFYFIFYPFGRFFIEFFRGDTPRIIFGLFTLSQIISIIVFFAALAAYIKLLNRKIRKIN
ncbi:MAG: prolipoprotein diacylglyceryl transferase [Candidatus Omnitrophota bacterium]|nr:prolipoprotein diacylglyceryl transferase [Candidatus Omnitrophota bacterium]